MKAVVNGITEEQISERRARGLDRWDEMWEGVLHMTPAPGIDHQGLIANLFLVLAPYIKRHGLGRIFTAVNVRDPHAAKPDYRVPDMVFVSQARSSILGKVYIDGGPDVVIEVLSADDETYEKLPFYERLRTTWAIVLSADGATVEVSQLVDGKLVRRAPDAAGWLRCEALAAAFRTAGKGGGLVVKLELDGREESIRA
jgi:Uma2 family endonuclease